ncbi:MULTISPECIES: DMT family transporter [Variovorax]|jgi:drug/metabolite transporter (DMT)-like permease|uniref:DMT family transporter n=1 Tax=Variovorax TaxID=34072 RepID=UPI000868E640|nr:MULTISPECIES: DMT family transporter [Variovorax]MBN8753489.1 DMT family transporter [Variovorax sp.]ODU15771.1 MAG: peptide ABC transporter ATP-binding protein [Variovorax sp. SCN 67-85]ODV27554.1 MAG: peptide ABC transporter ATP-binding protein [Variovorax sp. SCN 67-20]OJZ11440.1 MAG: peptide ABC transporter ATP-binding protein [Variovorax sp. 67-131]UKI05914.1 DMT family transporter [Variovorax paradoxus]
MTSAAPARNAGWLRAMPGVFVLIWSTGFIVARYGMPYAPPLKFLAVRYALSLVCFGAWVALARVAWPKQRAQWGHLAVTGVLMQAGYLGGVWAAVHEGMGAGLVALLVGIQPVLTAVWLSFNGGRISKRQWGGLALGFAGLVLVVSRKLGQGAEVSALTMGLALMALLSITAGTLYQKRFVAPCDVRSASAVQMAAALLVTLPFAALEPQHIEWNLQSGGAMAWSVLALSLGGSSLLYMLIQRGTATAVTSLLYLVPPCTAVMAWLLFSEPITLVTVLGIALTAVGVSLVVRGER